MALFDVGTGFFLGGVTDQANKVRQFGLQEAQLDLQRGQLARALDKDQKDQAMGFISEMVSIASEMKKNYGGTSDTFNSSKVGKSALALVKKAEDIALQVGLPFSGMSSLDATPTAADEAVTQATAEIAGAETKIDASEDDPQKQKALGVEPPKPESMTLVNASGDFQFIRDTRTPEGQAKLRRLEEAGYFKTTAQFQPQSGSDFPGIQKSEASEFRDLESATLTALDLVNEIESTLGEDATLTGFAQKTFTTLTGAASSLQQLAKLFGGEATVGNKVVDESLLLTQSYNFSKFEEPSLNTGAFRSNMITLAYLRARSLDPAGRVSDQDVQNMLNSMGGDTGNKDLIRGGLDAVRKQLRFSIRNRYSVLSKSTTLPPLDERFMDEAPKKFPRVDAIMGQTNVTPEDLDKLSEEEIEELERRLRLR